MEVPEFREDCHGCRISQGLYDTVGGILRLHGGWVANQYRASQAYLGWLVLQPRAHRDEFAELSSPELSTLGEHLKSLEASLRSYWRHVYSDDLIERTYFVYFFESPFDKPDPPPFHLHLHVIPRTRCIGAELRESEGTTSIINAWKIYRAVRDNKVPERYRRPLAGSWDAAANLMDYLRRELEWPR